MKRWTKDFRCRVCGGCDRDERHKGKRCNGYLSSDGEYAHCQREERAGSIDPHPKTGLFPHKLKGRCNCGETHGDIESNAAERHFVYQDEAGAPLFRVVRTPDKRFYQQHPVGDRWEPKLNGARLVPYRLPELLAADPSKTIYITEGEKCVEALRDRGLVATCNPMGAGKWHQIASDAARALAGRHVVVLPDDDASGRAHGDQVAAALQGVAASVRVVELYNGDTKRDVYDWLAEGRTAAELADLAKSAPNENGADLPPDPWKAALATALEDVRRRLTATTNGTCEPLFDLDAVDILAKKFDGARWLVTGLITRGGITTIGGLPKAAKKTWLGTEIAIAIATGTPVCGEFYAERGVVAYFYAEDMEDQIQNRIRSLLAGANRTLERGKLRPCPRGKFLDITRDEDLAWIVASCRRLGKLDVLVLDPLRDIHSAAEDKSDEMSPVMKRLRMLAEILDCTVVIVHHSGKPTADGAKRGGGQRLRGSGAVHGSTDSGIYILECDGDGQSTFRNTIESEIKGARSAGTFELNLDIEDDDQGAARATWTFVRPEPKVKGSKKSQDEDAVFAFVRELAIRGIMLSRTALKLHDERPIPEKRFMDALDRVIDDKRLELRNGRVELPMRSAA